MFDLVCAARVIGAPPLRPRVVIDDLPDPDRARRPQL